MWNRLICWWKGHGPIVSVLEPGPPVTLKHSYDYCERCGKSWYRSPIP